MTDGPDVFSDQALDGAGTLALPGLRGDLGVHRWLCGFAAALIPTFGLLLWSAPSRSGDLPAIGWGVFFVLFVGLVAASFTAGRVRRRMGTLARPLYGLLLVWTLVGGVLQSFSTEYAVVLLLVYTLAGIGLSVGLDRTWPLALYFGAAMVFVGVVYFRTARNGPLPNSGAQVDPLVIFVYLIGIGLVAFVVLSAHIRAQRRLATSRERYRLLTENAFDLIILCTPEGICRYASPAAETLVGCAPESLAGRSLVDQALPEDRDAVRQALRDIRDTGRRQTVTARFTCEGGPPVWLEANAQAAPGPEIDAPGEIVFVLRDVSAREERERQLRQARDDARSAAQSARETARAKTTFLAAMSHEVRTPLVSILGFADMLADILDAEERDEEGKARENGAASAAEKPTGERDDGERPGNGPYRRDEKREMVEFIRKGGQRLSETLSSVLDLARVEAGAVEAEPHAVPLADHLRETADQLRARADAKGLALRLDLPPEDCCARIDPALLARITTNLATNAIKFTDEGHVTLGAHAEGDRVTLVVEDTGPGISPDFQPHLFEEFEQAATRAPDEDGGAPFSEGSGLGLSIVKRLAEHSGGTVSVESALGEGSRFMVELPRADAPEDTDGDAPLPAAASPARILVVEDHPDTRRLLHRLLRPPHRVVAVADAAEALAAAREEQFDVLLLDINLDGQPEGVSLLGELRALPGYDGTPALAVTVYAFPEDRRRLLDAGFDDYLAKPFVRAQLVQRVQALRRRSDGPSPGGDSVGGDSAGGDGSPGQPGLAS